MTSYHPFKSNESKEEYMTLNREMESLWPNPSLNKTITTTYGDTFVRINGPENAPPLVLLAGALNCSLQWLPNIERLSSHFRTYAVDSLINTGSVGKSIYTNTIEKPEDAVSWLNELIDALDFKSKINMAGMSYGGWLTAQYALHFQDKLNKIVLLAPAILPVSLQFILHAIPIELRKNHNSIKGFLEWHLDFEKSKDRVVLARAINLMAVSKQSYEEAKYPMFSQLRKEELQRIKVPTYMLIGEKDKSYSMRRGMGKIKKAAPQWKIELLPDAGHSLPLDQAEIVNRKVLDFLA